MDEYQNIHESGNHIGVAHPQLFPCNDATKWCFSHLEKDTRLIVNASGVLISSLKTKYIKIHHKTPEPTMALDESFLDKFGVYHDEFETLMEDWFVDEEKPLK